MPEVEVGAKRSMDEDDRSSTKHAKSDGEEEDVEIRLLLLERSCGGIIGKGGENISRLRNHYNVHVQMPSTRSVDRAFTVRGNMENCISVVKELMIHSTQGPYSTNQQCAVELNLLVQTSMIGSILGKGGERIKEIREATNAKVKVYEECLPCSNERVIAIGGEENKQVLVALSTILNIIKDIPQRSRARYYDPSNKGGDGSGFGGRDSYHSDRDRDSSPFTQLHTVMNITAPNDICGAIIGKGGSRVREVRHTSGATITFSESEKDGDGDRVITISGPQGQVQVAQQLITQQCGRYAT